MQSFNLTQSYPGLDATVQSVRVWLFASPWQYPQSATVPMPAPLPQPEVTASQAHFVIYEGFTTRTNQQTVATSKGRGSIDTGPVDSALDRFKATTLEELLVAAFPAPGPDA